MLVLSRKLNEAIVVNDTIRVTVVAIKGDRVRIGIEAPRDVSVDRGEVHARKAMQVLEVLVPAGVYDETVDLGGVLVATADDTMR
jgi:carbon storage regulator